MLSSRSGLGFEANFLWSWHWLWPRDIMVLASKIQALALTVALTIFWKDNKLNIIMIYMQLIINEYVSKSNQNLVDSLSCHARLSYVLLI